MFHHPSLTCATIQPQPLLPCFPGVCHHPSPMWHHTSLACITVHPHHVPLCTPGMAAVCPSPPLPPHGTASVKFSHHAVRRASKPKPLLAAGGESFSVSPAKPLPAGWLADKRVAAAPLPIQLLTPDTRLPFPGRAHVYQPHRQEHLMVWYPGTSIILSVFRGFVLKCNKIHVRGNVSPCSGQQKVGGHNNQDF